jgi:hypothetical protein
VGGRDDPRGLGVDGQDYDLAAPDPAGTISSLSALGYSLETAVADIVDNSIDAEAKLITIDFHWAGEDSYVVIADDGTGMYESELVTAMTFGERGPQVDRGSHELGRFGMGLKTASFSQASQLIVWSKRSDSEYTQRVWDLHAVLRSKQWRLLRSPDQAGASILDKYDKRVRGTVVVWRNLGKIVSEGDSRYDESAHRLFFDAVDRVERHLGMVFTRFLGNGDAEARRSRVTICVNGSSVEPWDPFMQGHSGTLVQPAEHLAAIGSTVTVKPFILPPKRRLTDEQFRVGAGPRGWLDQQGFYIFRNDRLIVAGDWLGLGAFRKDEKHVLARVAVEVPSALDALWSIDVKKASAHAPLALKTDLTRIGKDIRAKSQSVLTHVGRTAALVRADDLSYAWRPERTSGELRVRLNWGHPLVKDALRSAGEGKHVIKALLRYLEETVPLPALRIMFDHEEDRDHVPFESVSPAEVVSVAEQMLAAFIHAGLTPVAAAKRLLVTHPFNEYLDLPEKLGLTAPDLRETHDG